MTASTSKRLQPEKVLALLQDGGPISRALPGFEVRHEQLEMLNRIVEAFNKGAVALIEAGTGTGKSIAYLIPALLNAALFGERVLVSTHTISLQEQIFRKDLPLLMKTLGIEAHTVLVKGMGNYPCLRKLQDLSFEKMIMSEGERRQVEEVEALAEKGFGTKSELSFTPSASIWDLVGAEQESCNGQECPHYSSCSYMNARKEAQEAKILIVNHHLLFADLAARAETQNYSTPAVLPPYTHIVIDEAHNLEEIATDYFSTRLSRLELLKTLTRVSTDKQGSGGQGKLGQLKDKMEKGTDKVPPPDFANLLTIDLPARRRDLFLELTQFFQILDDIQDGMSENGDEKKLRLRERHYDSKDWKENVLPHARRTKQSLLHYAMDLEQLESCLKEPGSERLFDLAKGILLEIKGLAKKIREAANVLEDLMETPPTAKQIRWIESRLSKHGLNCNLIQASLDISQLLFARLFEPFKTVILVSATLTARGSFDYLKERIGLSDLPDRLLIEISVHSPFNYEEQAVFIVPSDIPSPVESGFFKASLKLIKDAVDASRGNAFILFTSHQAMVQTYQAMEKELREARYFPLCQGEEGSSQLLKRFTEQDRSILFGTDSFWEGVDVAGEALRLVVIVKLPFKVPSDPLVEARSEHLNEKGKSPFYHLLLPQAAIKLKQGFGRLIRKKSDRGCVLCLDNRILKKNYGKYFLSTLPKCPLLTIPAEQMKKEMTEFFKKTYHLTKQKS